MWMPTVPVGRDSTLAAPDGSGGLRLRAGAGAAQAERTAAMRPPRLVHDADSRRPPEPRRPAPARRAANVELLAVRARRRRFRRMTPPGW